MVRNAKPIGCPQCGHTGTEHDFGPPSDRQCPRCGFDMSA